MIEVKKASGLGLVVGQQRRGFQAYGVPSGGPLNSLSLARCNALLDNDPSAAGLELTGYFVLAVQQPCSVVVGPAGARVTLDGQPLPAGRVCRLPQGSVLKILGASQGLWTQLAVQGGLAFEEVLGSRGSCLAGGFGGLDGRVLASGDRLSVCAPERGWVQKGTPVVAMPALDWGLGSSGHPVPIRALRGPEFTRLCQSGLEAESLWTLNINSSRMGYRFDLVEPVSVQATAPVSMASYACSPGLIQVPPSGCALVLMADCQVTGGYPRLGSIVTSELWKIALLTPGQMVRFDWVSLSSACQYNEKAQREWLRFEEALKAFRGET